MSTVKIKTEPATTAAATAAVDVKVKLEPSLSPGDIKLEQHTSDIDTKVEPDSDIDIEEENEIKSESNDDDETDHFTITPKNQRQFICKHPGCDRGFNFTGNLNMHQHEHKFQTELHILGKTYTLIRQSLGDRWTCPVPECTSTSKTVDAICNHMRTRHSDSKKQRQQPQVKKTRYNCYFLNVDNFYVNGIRYGYHNIIGVFICYECRLVPECLLAHLQQKHEYDEKSIDNSALPDNAVNANADPNINQHTSNPQLASAIRQPYQWSNSGIVQGWLCVTSNCGYCGYIVDNKNGHKQKMHKGEQISTVPALVLRFVYAKARSSYFLITRIGQASGAVTNSSNRMSQHRLDYSHNGLNTQDENGDEISQDETTGASNQKRRYICEYPDCNHSFNSAGQLSMHRFEHKLEVLIGVKGTTFALTRQSPDDRWSCPVSDCEKTYKTVCGARKHMNNTHRTSLKQKHANMENENSKQQQQPIIKRRHPNFYYLNVDDFYISGTRCGYHTSIGVFICHKCRLVPECLLTHLQQKHGYNEKSIDNSVLPEIAASTNADPNISQHTSNTHLAPVNHDSTQPLHPDIVQGWLCVTSNCGYCGYSARNKSDHKQCFHRGEQITTAPALVLQLFYGKMQTNYFLIPRLDTTTSNSANACNPVNQHNSECGDDDGDELVLSDMGDDDDIS